MKSSTDLLERMSQLSSTIIPDLLERGILPDSESTITLYNRLAEANRSFIAKVFEHTKEMYGGVAQCVLIKPRNNKTAMLKMLYQIFQGELTHAEIRSMVVETVSYTGLTTPRMYNRAWRVDRVNYTDFETYLAVAELKGIKWDEEFEYVREQYLNTRLDTDCVVKKWKTDTDLNYNYTPGQLVRNVETIIEWLQNKEVRPSVWMVGNALSVYRYIDYLIEEKRLAVPFNSVFCIVPSTVKSITEIRDDCNKFITLIGDCDVKNR